MNLASPKRVFPGVNMDQARDQVRDALRRAFSHCGGQAKFARALNERLEREGQKTVTPQAVSWWVSEGTFIDQRYWRHIEELTDLATTRRHLRPDVYGLGQP